MLVNIKLYNNSDLKLLGYVLNYVSLILPKEVITDLTCKAQDMDSLPMGSSLCFGFTIFFSPVLGIKLKI